MTAFICAPRAGRIDLLTDGAMYTPDGVLVRIGLKAVEMPACNAAFVVRGENLIRQELEKAFSRLSGFGNLIAVAADTLPRVREWALQGAIEWEVLIAGFSEVGPELHFFEAHRDGVLRRIDDDCDFVAPAAPMESVEDFDVYRHGLPMMEAMRQLEDETGYRVGGHVAHTQITRERVSTEIIHMWPDVVGLPITPCCDAAAMMQRPKA